VRRRGWAVTSA